MTSPISIFLAITLEIILLGIMLAFLFAPLEPELLP